MRDSVQIALRRFTKVARPLALRSAGKSGSSTAVIRHVGRNSGRDYQTPVTVVGQDDTYFIALPYGQRTDWLKNVLASGVATLVVDGKSCPVDKPEVVSLSEVSHYFRPRDQRLLRRFRVESALRLHRA